MTGERVSSAWYGEFCRLHEKIPFDIRKTALL